MPLTVYQTYIPYVSRAEGTYNIPNTWQSNFNVITNTAAMTLTLTNTITFSGNAEIIIRNYFTSTDDITIAASGFTIDVSGDLGLLIPPGGIGELKRLGGSSVWSFYGFINS